MATQPLDPAAAPGPVSLAELPGRAVRAWDRFWFAKGDPTVLGLIRILAGVLTLYVHIVYTGDLQPLFGKQAWLSLETMNEIRHDQPVVAPPLDWESQPKPLPPPASAEEKKRIDDYMQTWGGADPRRNLTTGSRVWSVWFHVTDPGWMMLIHLLTLVVMLLFTVGLCTRVTSALTWLLALSYIQRAPTTLFGLDTMMIIVLLYLMIGPSGAALSLDRLLAHWWARRRAEGKNRPAPAWQPPQPSVTANFALRLIQVHFCMIYLASGLSKLQGAAWWNGTAMWGTMANYEFAPLNWAHYEDFLIFLCNHRPLWEVLTSGGVVFTLMLEIGFPFLVWPRPTRWLMIIGSVMMHTGISLTMGLTTFSLMMLTMLLAFVPAAAVKRLLAALTIRRAAPEREAVLVA
jgi:Vitamin K-dependent gamma-carboxylase